MNDRSLEQRIDFDLLTDMLVDIKDHEKYPASRLLAQAIEELIERRTNERVAQSLDSAAKHIPPNIARTSKQRPRMRPSISRADYIQELARYTGVSVPKHIFAPSWELEAILEHLANVGDEFARLQSIIRGKTFVTGDETQSAASKPVAWRRLIDSPYEKRPRYGYWEEPFKGGEPLYLKGGDETTARPFDEKFEAYVAHLIGCTAEWSRGAGAMPPRVEQALRELREHYYGGTPPEKSGEMPVPTEALTELCALRGELELTVEHLETANNACEAASKRLDEMTTYMHSIRPKADCYDRICQTLGIENDILGYIEKLRGAQKSAETDARRTAEYWKTEHNAANREIERLQAVLKRIGDPEFKYSSDDDDDDQLSLRMADARVAEKSGETFGWLPMESAPKDRPILGLCSHAADPGPDSSGRISPYLAHAEGLSHVEDGPHVLVWGGEYRECDWESGANIHIPPWWFRSDSDFEVAANPIGWLPIPAGAAEKSSPPRCEAKSPGFFSKQCQLRHDHDGPHYAIDGGVSDTWTAVKTTGTPLGGERHMLGTTLEEREAEKSEASFDRRRFQDNPPCYICGYNGPGYFQPGMHKCAELYYAENGNEPTKENNNG